MAEHISLTGICRILNYSSDDLIVDITNSDMTRDKMPIMAYFFDDIRADKIEYDNSLIGVLQIVDLPEKPYIPNSGGHL